MFCLSFKKRRTLASNARVICFAFKIQKLFLTTAIYTVMRAFPASIHTAQSLTYGLGMNSMVYTAG
jgi:hypothetical protein